MWDNVATPSLLELEKAIEEPSSAIGMRMRAAYFLKQAYVNNNNNNSDEDPSSSKEQEAVIRCLSNGLADKRHGSLMRHEYAYVMGQLQDERCCNVLERILLTDDDCSMVRHEAAEALAAIGATRSRQALKEAMDHTQNDTPEVYETCLLALNMMDWRDRGDPTEEMPVACACMTNPYSSVDPAPPHPAHANLSSVELGDLLCNPQLSIFDRYRAMFSLRNRGGEDSVLQLSRALLSDDTSALLRHEISYVLGQMQHPKSIPALEASLRRKDEHQMVRHESAEALGAIEGEWETVEAILKEFTKDDNQVVRESCLVALDAADYWGHSNNNHSTADQEEEEADIKPADEDDDGKEEKKL